MNPPFIRNAYNYDRNQASDEAGLDCNLAEEPSLTQQQFKEESDINEIMRRFGQGETLPPDYTPPISGDFTGIQDFHTAMNAVTKAQQQFMELPAETRERFNNDPQRLLNFLDNDENRDEAIKLKIIQPPPEKVRTAIEAIDELKTVLTPAATTK